MFTQEDPIGLTGGLNLYGFAGGDPVNFTDPFGLCPEHRRREDGTCPGGLTVREWENVERSFSNLTGDARARANHLLQNGLIRPDELAPHVGGRTDWSEGAAYINRNSDGVASYFEASPATLAWLVAHESEHVQQAKGKSGLTILGMKLLLGAEKVQAWIAGLGRDKEFRVGYERSADEYACPNTVGEHAYQRFCR